MKRILSIIFVALFSVACLPTSQQVEQAIDKTQTALTRVAVEASPTTVPTPSPVPLSDIDLESIAFSDGDLPANSKLGQVTDKLRKEITSVPEPVQLMVRPIHLGDYSGDGVAIMLYDDKELQDQAFVALQKYVKRQSKKVSESSDIGEKSIIGTDDALGIPSIKIIFQRCSAITYIDIFGYKADEITPTYAKRLDRRLAKEICK